MAQNDVEMMKIRRRRASQTPKSHTFLVMLCHVLLLSSCCCAQDDEQVERRSPAEQESRECTLTDVWLCLLCSLGWTVWMVAAHIRPQVEQYATDATVVYGNVLHTSVIVGDGAIPMYRAVIDYVLHDVQETQVRKEFTTDEMLQEGFANVEILVLPTDPTSGVLKKDWEVEYQQFLKHNATRKKARMLSLVLGAILVTISLAGAAMTVRRLPVEKITWGWVSIVIGVALLWPMAILLYANGNELSNLATQSRQQKGVVIRGEQPPLQFSLNPCVSVDGSEGISITTHVSTPKRSSEPKTTKPPAIEVSRIPTNNNKERVVMPPHLRVKINDESVEPPRPSAFGCYFINLPASFGARMSSHQSLRSGSISSVSSASVTPYTHHPPSMKDSNNATNLV